MTAFLEARDIGVRFGGLDALSGISFSIAETPEIRWEFRRA